MPFQEVIIVDQPVLFNPLVGEDGLDELRQIVTESVTQLLEAGGADVALVFGDVTKATQATAVNDGYCVNCYGDQVVGFGPFCSRQCADEFSRTTLCWVGGGFSFFNPSAY